MSYRSIQYAGRHSFWDMWFKEVHAGEAGFTFRIKNILYSGQSRFQRIDIFDTYGFGKVLVLYGSIMFTERDEFIYHEMLSHVACYAHHDPKHVLIIGGGDGGTVREICRHPVERVTVVEIDEMVVQLCREHFPDHHGFDHACVELIHADGARYVAETAGSVDIIAIDSADPVPPADVLFEESFFANCKKWLNPGGILVAQTESPFLNPDVIGQVVRALKRVFAIVRLYTAVVPTYPGALWSFAFCSDTVDPLDNLNEQRIDDDSFDLKYYMAAVHRAAFQLPAFVQHLL